MIGSKLPKGWMKGERICMIEWIWLSQRSNIRQKPIVSCARKDLDKKVSVSCKLCFCVGQESRNTNEISIKNVGKRNLNTINFSADGAGLDVPKRTMNGQILGEGEDGTWKEFVSKVKSAAKEGERQSACWMIWSWKHDEFKKVMGVVQHIQINDQFDLVTKTEPKKIK